MDFKIPSKTSVEFCGRLMNLCRLRRQYSSAPLSEYWRIAGTQYSWKSFRLRQLIAAKYITHRVSVVFPPKLAECHPLFSRVLLEF